MVEHESILARCEKSSLRMTEQRRVIAETLDASDDHPDAETVYARASERDPAISLATVYRTLKLFEETGIIDRLQFQDGKARYEDAERSHHDHLIDVTTGEVIEFVSPEIERLQSEIAAKLGYRLVDHRLQLYAVPLDADEDDES